MSRCSDYFFRFTCLQQNIEKMYFFCEAHLYLSDYFVIINHYTYCSCTTYIYIYHAYLPAFYYFEYITSQYLSATISKYQEDKIIWYWVYRIPLTSNSPADLSVPSLSHRIAVLLHITQKIYYHLPPNMLYASRIKRDVLFISLGQLMLIATKDGDGWGLCLKKLFIMTSTCKDLYQKINLFQKYFLQL